MDAALKPLFIDPFEGDNRAYPTFRNHFLEIIERQPGLEPRHKLQYLLQYLRGEPHRIASGYMITDGNYLKVLDHLEERYGDQQSISHGLNAFMADTHVIQKKCVYCSRPHWSSQCDVYDTIVKRRRRLHQLKYCFLCLRGGHWTATCPKRTNEPCRYCNNGQHHQSLCRTVISSLKERRPGPMCATKIGMPHGSTPTDEPHGSSSPKQVWGSTPVTQDGAQEAPPATTVRSPSTQNSSTPGGKSNSQHFRQGKSKGPRTDPSGRDGTTPPTTTCVNESMTSKDAYASGSAEFLLQQTSLRTTDRCSTTDEMAQFDRPLGRGGTRVSVPRIAETPDGTGSHELDAEDASPNQPRGQLTDGVQWPPINEPTTRFAQKIHDSEDDASTPILECLITTAKNPWTDDSCEAVVVFDHRRTESIITKELVRALKLPAASTPTRDLDSFTGYYTSLDLLSPGNRKLSLDNLATGPLPPIIRTVLVDEKLLAAIRKDKSQPDIIYAQPHLLIGADLMQRIQYRHGPRLQGGLYSVHSTLGVAIGGKLQADTETSSKASTKSDLSSSLATAPATDDVQDSARSSRRSLPSTTEPSASRLQHWLQDLPSVQPTYLVGGQTDSSPEAHVHLPTYLVGDAVGHDTHEFLEPSTTTTNSSGPLSARFRASGTTPPSTQQQLPSKPLDTQPLQLPTTPTTTVEVEDVAATYLVARPPGPIQDQLSSTEAELRHRTPPPPILGLQICASLYDAGSITMRKTRLRYRVPAFARHLLGIYAAQAPVPAVILLFHTDSTFLHLLRAEQELQLVWTNFALHSAPPSIYLPRHVPPSSTPSVHSQVHGRPPSSGRQRFNSRGPATIPFADYDQCVAYQRTHAGPSANKRLTPPTGSRQLETHTQPRTPLSAQGAASSPLRSH